MKLAQALSERSDLQTRLAQMTQRLTNNAIVQEGDAPAEDPSALLSECDQTLARLEELVSRINLTNAATKIDGVTLTELISRRDALKRKVALLRTFLDAASARVDRYSRTEIRLQSTVDVAALRKDVDRMSKELRETDEKIQEQNWLTELL